MSTARVNDADVVCPYWRGWIAHNAIRCESFVVGADLRLTFTGREGRNSYSRAFCKRNYVACPIAQATKKEMYPDDDEPGD